MPITTLTREFLYEDEILPDPDPSMTTDEVIGFYSAKYPALVTAHVESQETKKDKIVYTIGPAIGTKA